MIAVESDLYARADRQASNSPGNDWSNTKSGRVVSLDAYGGVDAESTGALPGEHAGGIGFVEQSVRAKVTEYATLDDMLELEPVVGLKDTGWWGRSWSGSSRPTRSRW